MVIGGEETELDSLFEPLCPLDEATLKDRLDRLEIDRSKPKKISMKEAADLLQKRLDALSETKLREEIYPLLPPDNHVGLLMVIRASVSTGTLTRGVLTQIPAYSA